MSELEPSKPFQSHPNTEARYAHGPFRRRLRPHPHPTVATPDVIAPPEQTELDYHKEQVADEVRGLFDAIDTHVGRMIGHSGNIREELRRRVGPRDSQGRHIDMNGLDPALQEYLDNDVFFFRRDNKTGGPAAMYKIDCQTGRFLPSLQVETTDGFFEATLSMGPDTNQFHHTQIRRVFNDGRVHHLTTFPPNYNNPSDPPHPLVLGRGVLPVPRHHAIYDQIDHEGNVTLLNTIGSPDPHIHFPEQTNIYAELAEISQNIATITS